MSHHRPIIAAVALCVLLPAIPASAAEAGFVQGPYLQLPTVTGITVFWQQDIEGAGEVRVGPVGGALDKVYPAPAGPGRKEVVVADLDPGTRYEYEVAVAGGETSPRASFSTAFIGPGPFRWALYGDTRSSAENHAAVVASILSEGEIHFGVQTGDMVSDGEVPEQWDEYFDIEQPLMRGVPVYPVIGNHDEFDGVATELTERFAAPENSPMPEHYYSFRYGNSWFTVLDGHVNMLSPEECLFERDLLVLECMTTEQIDWVEGDLEAAATAEGVEHIFVLVHIGPYSSKENRSGSMDVRRLLPLFKAMGVTAVLSGHDHYYERGRSAFGMPYIISGGAGASLYDLHEPSSAPHEVFANESVHHHVIVDVDGPQVTFTARRSDGSILDTHTLTKPPPECDADADCDDVEPPPDCVPPGTCSPAKRCGFDCAVEGLNPFPELVEDLEGGDAEADATSGAAEEAPDAAEGPAAADDAGEVAGPSDEVTSPTAPTGEDATAGGASTDEPPASGGCSGGPMAPVSALILSWLLALRARRARGPRTRRAA